MADDVQLNGAQGPPVARVTLQSLTGLRFLAALHVVLFHYALKTAGAERLPLWLQSFINAGPASVCLFFALSGFVLAYNYVSGGKLRTGPGEFYAARFARVYPVYALAFIMYLPLALVKMKGAHLISSGLLSAVLLQAWTPFAVEWNPPAWSLSVEAFFYLVFPFLALRVYRTRLALSIAGALAFWLAGVVAAFLLPGQSYFPLLFLPSFILGIVAARIRSAGVSLPSRTAYLWLALIGMALIWLPWQHAMNLGLLTPLYTLLIFSLSHERETYFSRFLASSALVALGEASYVLYITHVPLWNYLIPAYNYTSSKTWSNFCPYPVLFWSYLVLAVGASLLCYQFFEKPARSKVKRWLGGGKAISEKPGKDARVFVQG